MSARAILFACPAFACLSLVLASPASAHPQEFGSIHAREIAPGRYAIRFEYSGTEGAPRGASIAWPEGCAPEGPTETSTRPYVESQRMIVRCERAGLAREVAIEALPADVEIAVRIERLDGSRRAQLLDAGAPRFALATADEELGLLLARFFELGVEHIAFGFDHLAFVAMLVLVVRRASAPRLDARALAQPLVVTLSAFTVGHAITLALSMLERVRAPVAPVEVCIALSVLLLAAEVARSERGGAADTLVFRRPTLVAGAFGLVHGLGFASALRDAGVSDAQLAWSLVGFHLGIELGQLAFVVLVLAGLAALEARAWAPSARLALAYVTGAAAAAWTLARLGTLA